MKKVVKKSTKQTTKKVATTKGNQSPMSKKHIATLKRLAAKANKMYDLVQAMLKNIGEWYDGEGKDRLVYKASPMGIYVRKLRWGEYEIGEGGNSQIKYKVNDAELGRFLEAHREKLAEAKKKARAKIQARALKDAKKFAHGKSQDEMLAKLKACIGEKGVSVVLFVAQRNGSNKESKHTTKDVLKVVGELEYSHLIVAVSRFDFQDEKVVEVYLDRKPKEKKKTDGIAYMDVFRRVAQYMGDNGYYLNVGEVDGEEEARRPFEEWYDDCEEDDGVSVKICDEEDDREGEQWLNWDSVEDFLTATLNGHHANTNSEGCASIFEAVACWKANESKLVYPCLKWLLERIGKLGEVDVENPSPTGLMKQLDELGI